MSNAFKMGIIFALGALVWVMNSVFVGLVSSWLISRNFQTLLYFAMGLDYPALFFITGFLAAKAVETIRDICRQS